MAESVSTESFQTSASPVQPMKPVTGVADDQIVRGAAIVIGLVLGMRARAAVTLRRDLVDRRDRGGHRRRAAVAALLAARAFFAGATIFFGAHDAM